MISAQSETSQLYSYVSVFFRRKQRFSLTSILYSIEVLITVLILVVLTPSKVSAQVVINEFSPASDPEWVELFKTQDGQLSLDDCTLHLDDNLSGSQKIVFTSSDNIGENENFFLINKGDYNWTSNWLNNNGDKVSIICSWGSDVVSYGNQDGASLGKPDSSESIGRSPDGTSQFYVLTNQTPGVPNSPPPTPTPNPTSTPIPEPTIINTPTSKPTPTLTPTKAPAPTIKAVLTDRPETSNIDKNQDRNSENTVLGLRNELSPAPTPPLEEDEKGKFPLGAVFLILGGLAFMGAASYPFVKNAKFFQSLRKSEEKEYNFIDEKED